jgi:hypothetical protein
MTAPDQIMIDRELLEDLEECVRTGTRHSDAADAAWELLYPVRATPTFRPDRGRLVSHVDVWESRRR